MKEKHIQHLYWRMGFGILPETCERLSEIKRSSVVAALFENSQAYTPLNIDLSEFENINIKRLKKNAALQSKLRQKSVQRLKDFNIAWLERLTNPKEILRERMCLFWANHFACRDTNILHVQQLNNTIRVHALGDFRALVKAISKEAAMIKYLNTKQNRKGEPNENFARELMELFTLGIGHYSEKHIKESAKAFTGYNHDFYGNFILKKHQHDTSVKHFFGSSGSFVGDDIIDLILEEKQCAVFICEKLYKYFVNYNINREHIDAMVAVFYPNYNIEALMRFICEADWFYDARNMGSKIKSPMDWFIGLRQFIPIHFKKPAELFKIQKVLGQTLLNPPNVAGWAGHQSWIDSNTILLRLKLPTLLLNRWLIPSTQNAHYKVFTENKRSIFSTEPDWDSFESYFSAYSLEQMERLIIQTKISPQTQRYLETQKTLSKADYFVQLVSLPEFQLC